MAALVNVTDTNQYGKIELEGKGVV